MTGSTTLGDKLSGITVPTLVIVGAHDLIYPMEESRLIAERIPGAELMEGANHPVHIKKNGLVIARILEFMDL